MECSTIPDPVGNSPIKIFVPGKIMTGGSGVGTGGGVGIGDGGITIGGSIVIGGGGSDGYPIENSEVPETTTELLEEVACFPITALDEVARPPPVMVIVLPIPSLPTTRPPVLLHEEGTARTMKLVVGPFVIGPNVEVILPF